MAIKDQPTRQDLRERTQRAEEWRAFRRNHLYTQTMLASVLHCSRRTVASVESGHETTRPHASLLFRFRQLKLKHERERERDSKAVA